MVTTFGFHMPRGRSGTAGLCAIYNVLFVGYCCTSSRLLIAWAQTSAPLHYGGAVRGASFL